MGGMNLNFECCAADEDLATTATALPETCQDGFELVDGGCYKFSEEKKTFDEARAACQAIAEGYDLAIPNSPELVANLWKLTVGKWSSSHPHSWRRSVGKE